MIGNDKIWFLRGGLFAKYVVSLVGLVVFVLAVNGAMETWISYRGTRTTLTDAMSEKADATARRIEQSASELERKISWVTRASVVTIEQRRADYAQLLNQVPAVSQIFWLNGNGREQLRLTRATVSVSSGADFSRDVRFTETVARGVSFAPAYFKEQHPFMSIAVAHSGFNAGATVAEVDLSFLADFVGDAQVGRAAYAYVVDARGQVLASSTKGPEVAKDLAKLPQVAALIAPATRELEELAGQFNSMAGQLQETYSGLETKVEERTRDLAQSINELKVLEEVGRAVASSLDLNAVLPTVAARALEITHADAVLIYSYDAAKHYFNLTEAIGIDQDAEGAHL